MNQQFLDILSNTPSLLAKMIDVANEWYKIQGELPATHPDPDGPTEFHAGDTHALRTTGIDSAEIDAIMQGYATAIVKEKAVQYVRGFISGVMFAS